MWTVVENDERGGFQNWRNTEGVLKQEKDVREKATVLERVAHVIRDLNTVGVLKQEKLDVDPVGYSKLPDKSFAVTIKMKTIYANEVIAETIEYSFKDEFKDKEILFLKYERDGGLTEFKCRISDNKMFLRG